MLGEPIIHAPFMWHLRPSRDLIVGELSGELDVAAESELDAFSTAALAAGAAGLVMDLRHLDFMDSTGLRWLVTLRDSFDGHLQLVHGPVNIQRILEMTGLLHHFEFVSTTQLAQLDAAE